MLVLLIVALNAAAGTPSERHLDVAVERAEPFDPDRPAVVLIYQYSGEKPLRFSLPKEEELPSFRGLEVLVDGRPAPHILELDPLVDPKHSVVVELEPGESHRARFDLGRIFRIAESWRVLEVRVKKTHSLMRKMSELELRREADTD